MGGKQCVKTRMVYIPEWYIPAFDNHLMCSHCRSETGQCQLILSSPCEVCEVWPIENWYRLLRNLINAKEQGSNSGKAHWNNTVTNLPGSGLPVLPDRSGSPQVLKFLAIPLQSPPPTTKSRMFGYEKTSVRPSCP